MWWVPNITSRLMIYAVRDPRLGRRRSGLSSLRGRYGPAVGVCEFRTARERDSTGIWVSLGGLVAVRAVRDPARSACRRAGPSALVADGARYLPARAAVRAGAIALDVGTLEGRRDLDLAAVASAPRPYVRGARGADLLGDGYRPFGGTAVCGAVAGLHTGAIGAGACRISAFPVQTRSQGGAWRLGGSLRAGTARARGQKKPARLRSAAIGALRLFRYSVAVQSSPETAPRPQSLSRGRTGGWVAGRWRDVLLNGALSMPRFQAASMRSAGPESRPGT